jgi:outer membrane protein OmpA-like peptidoglycan-associated protein
VAVRGARPSRRWLWWALALLAVPTTLATLAVLAPATDPPATTRTAGVADDAVADLSIVAAPPGARPTPADRDPVAAERERVAVLLADRPIAFTADSAELTAPAAAAVQEAARLLAAVPTVPVLVEGHAADTPGGLDAGRLLSERRADVVADALVAAGLAGDRIATRGRGAEVPLATVERSRRVEISIR